MKNWYLLMNDYSQQDRFIHIQGVTDVRITHPVDSSHFSFPFDLEKKSCPDDIYYNLFRLTEINFDFYDAQCWHVSTDFWSLLSSIHKVSFNEKNLFFSFQGRKLDTKKHYKIIYFPIDNVDLIDYEKSVFYPPKRGRAISEEQLIPKNLVLNNNANDYDLIVFGKDIIYMGMIAITDKVKDILEKKKDELVGYKIVPINDALPHFCNDYCFKVEEHLRKERPRLP